MEIARGLGYARLDPGQSVNMSLVWTLGNGDACSCVHGLWEMRKRLGRYFLLHFVLMSGAWECKADRR